MVRQAHHERTTNGPRTDHERTRILRIGNILKITKSGKSWFRQLLCTGPGLDAKRLCKVRQQVALLRSPWACRRAVRSWFDKLTTNGPRTDKDTQDWEYPENHQIRQILIQTITLPKPWACRRAVRSWFDKLTTIGPRTDHERTRILRIGNILKLTKSGKS